MQRPATQNRHAQLLPLTVALLGLTFPVAAQELAPQAMQQIVALTEEKLSRTPAQKKIDSRLLYELAARQKRGFTKSFPKLEVVRHADKAGKVLLDLDAVPDDELRAAIEAAGGTVHSAFARWKAVRATVPIDQLEQLAALDQVSSIRPADAYMTQMTNTTEGDVAHAANAARTTFSVDGTGVKVGAMSDSVDSLAALQGSGDLPAGVTVLAGQSGNPGTSEGTALLEIVHDMAPGAELFFATGAGGQAQMAQNILDLQAAGCQVIVDDVLYFSELVFQDDVIAQAVDEVAALGTTYFSSAGNSGNLAAGTSGVWEGDYSGIALPTPLAAAGLSAHDFGSGANSNEITFDSPFFFTLQWADPGNGATNDYDLYILDAALANVIAASTSTQNGTQDPFEIINSTARDDLGNRIVVVKVSGDDRFIHVNAHRGQLGEGTDGQIFGHPAAEGAIATAAVNVATAGGGVFTGGVGNPPEPFTSDGPRRIFFEADGTPVGAARVGGKGVEQSEVREKPDLSTADGVMTATPGFNPFFGTSASAPHAAGIAALIKEILSSLSPTGVKERMTDDARDIGDPGKDNVTGDGIPLTDEAISGLLGFQGTNFSINLLLGLTGSKDCFGNHKQAMDDNTALFDGLEELLDAYTNGTQPFVFEFEDDPGNPDSQTGNPQNAFDSEITAKSMDPTDDLFPDGFEDPETNTPLDSACIEIGIDDALDGDTPVSLTSAQVQFFNETGPVGDPFDFLTSVSDPWDGRLTGIFPGLAGQGINEVRLNLTTDAARGSDIFADGFESGDATSWTNSSP